MTDCKLSIIIPHYNTPQSLESLLSVVVGYEDTELIVIDDHSTAHIEQLEACKTRFQGQVRFLCNESSRNSAGSCRNCGIELAKGQWLMFADADDLLLENWHDTVSPYLYGSEQDVIYFPPQALSRVEGEKPSRHLRFAKLVQSPPHWKRDARLRYQVVVPWSKLIRRSLVEKHGVRFDDTLYSNDVMFSVKTGFYAESIACCSTPIYCLVETAHSLTHQTNEKAFMIRAAVGIDRERFLRQNLPKREYAYLSWWGLRELLVRSYQAVQYHCKWKTWGRYVISYLGFLTRRKEKHK